MDDQTSALTKFCDIETGLKILNSQALRWSAPHLFQDPFELDYRSTSDFTADQFLKGLIKEAINMLFGPNEPRGKSNRLVAAIARWRDEERFASEEEAETVLKQLLTQLAEQQQLAIDKYLQDWQRFASLLRVCCFCDKPDNMAAWQRYAANHSGIALKFQAGEDSSLPKPRKISYSTNPPCVTSLSEQVGIAYGKEERPDKAAFIDKFLQKNRDNNGEREWRCFEVDNRDPDQDDQLWYTDKTFKTNELKAVYLGLGISPANRQQIVELVRRDYKNTRLFSAEAVAGKYEIQFSQLQGS